MRRPRNIAIKLVLFLLLGAIINVAVAWGHVIVAPLNVAFGYTGVIEFADVPTWEIATWHQRGAMLVSAEAHLYRRPGEPACGTSPKWSWSTRPPTRQQARQETSITERAYGWPVLSMFSRTIQPSWGSSLQEVNGGVRIEWLAPRSVFPLIPIWPGFLINTLVHAALMWPLVAAGRAARQIVRNRLAARRGQCLHCGYDLRGQPPDSSKCPECGNMVIAKCMGLPPLPGATPAQES